MTFDLVYFVIQYSQSDDTMFTQGVNLQSSFMISGSRFDLYYKEIRNFRAKRGPVVRWRSAGCRGRCCWKGQASSAALPARGARPLAMRPGHREKPSSKKGMNGK